MEVPNGLETLARRGHDRRAAGHVPRPQVPAAVLDALRQASADGKRILSLCTGAFVLAAAGMLDGQTATTHWSECARPGAAVPQVNVDPGVLYVDEGDLLTSAGSAASLDLCLHVVQRDHGTEIATRVARDLVVPLHRPGGQAQYIETPMPRLTGERPVRRHAHLAAGAPGRAGGGRRPGGARGDEPAHVRPPVPGEHRDDAAAVDAAASASGSRSGCWRPPSCPSTPSRARAASARRTTCASTSRATVRTTPQAYRRAFQDLSPLDPRRLKACQ